MKKSFILWIAMLTTCMASAQVSTWNGTHEPWTHGTGTEADPFLIENAQQLAYLAYRVNNGLDAGGGHVSNHDLHYKLMVDVDLNGSEDFQWTPIGYWNSDADYQCFGGYFNGNGHMVSSLYINRTANWVGFFGYTVSATVKNLSLSGTTVTTTGTYAGGIIGYADNTIILNCNNNNYTSSLSAGTCYAGGIIGYCENTIISNCANAGSVHTQGNGGKFSGGIVGYAGTTNKIINCYNTANISCHTIHDRASGGIVGISSTITITNCYNLGEISCINESTNKGGIIGQVIGQHPTVFNSYYLNTCGGNNAYGGLPMSADAMQTQEFIELLNNGYCAWEYDYNNTNSGYPILTEVSFSAFTKPATNISATTATLNGSIIVENTNVVAKGFEYRIAGTSSFTTINVSGNNNNISYNLIDLTPNTTYEYRAFVNVSDCDITAYGEIETFEVTWQNQDTIFIYDADILLMVAEQCNSGVTFEGKCVKLMNDITLPLNVPNNMISIGSYPYYPFKGTFDGNGKLISNLYIDQPNTPYQGFFGYTRNANLYNVGLVNITASGRNYTGGMVAYAENTHMRDCYVNGGTLFALSYCGGLVGYQGEGTNSIISGCYNTCTVTGNHYVGGLVGYSDYSTVRNSYVAAPVSGQGNGVGAIIGGANEVLMYYCYFSTEITGQTNAIGENNNGNGKDGGEGLTNAQMRDPQFVNTLNQGLVTPIWIADYTTHINNGFPIIKWQRPGTGVEENQATKNCISLYPNPANGFVTIQSDEPNVSLKYVEIYDVMGRKVMSRVLNGQCQGFSIEILPAGIYNVRILTDNGCYTNLKLVVQ